MRTPILTILLVVPFISALAQQDTIANADFESWGTNPFYDEPDNWTTLNPLASILGAELAFKADGSGEFHSGAAAIKLVTTDITGIGVTPSVLTNGTINSQTQSVEGGNPIASRPLSFGGWFRYDPANLDTAFLSVVLTKWNTGTGSRDIIGSIDTVINNSNGVFVNYDVAFSYASQEIPDTVLITIGSGTDVSPQEGSALYADDLYYGYPQGVSTVYSGAVTTYPNPTTDFITIESAADFRPTSFSIISLDGREICAGNILDSRIDVRKLIHGTYLLVLTDSSNTSMAKVLVKH